MSNSNSNQLFDLRVLLVGEYQLFINCLLYDAQFQLIESSSKTDEAIVYTLPKGLYTLRANINGNFEELSFFLDSALTLYVTNSGISKSKDEMFIQTPQVLSADLIRKTESGYQPYYLAQAIKQSKRSTKKDEDPSLNSSLFIFLRYSSKEAYQKHKKAKDSLIAFDFKLIDEWGNTLSDFKNCEDLAFDRTNGSVALNLKVPDGVYYLVFTGEEPRQIPLYVYKNWHTQFFMILGRQPKYLSIRVFISKKRVYDPNDKYNKITTILLDKLYNQDFTLNDKIIDEIAYSKEQHPILALLCTYIYLKSDNSISDGLFKKILRNLQDSILPDNQESADIRALNILASEHFENYKYKTTNIKGIPMFRIGFEAILNASVKNKNLIRQNSVNDFVSENLYYDSPFCTFKPIKLPKKKEQVDHLLPLTKKAEKHFMIIEKSNEPRIDPFTKEIHTLFDSSVFNYLTSIEFSKSENSWVENYTAAMINEQKNISINTIAEELKVSGNTINRILKEWKKEAKPKKK